MPGKVVDRSRTRWGESRKASRGYNDNSWNCTVLPWVPLEVLSPPWAGELVGGRGAAGMDLNIWLEGDTGIESEQDGILIIMSLVQPPHSTSGKIESPALTLLRANHLLKVSQPRIFFHPQIFTL